MNKPENNPVCVYVDFWEDYENIGDVAMLLNAFRRLELHLGPCRFVIPHSPRKVGKIQYPGLITVFPPHLEVLRYSTWVRAIHSKILKLLPSRFAASKVPSFTFLDVAKSIVNFNYFLYSLGLRFVFSKPFQLSLDELKKCDVYFSVGDGSINDYWLDGIIFKSWILEFVRSFVSVSVLSSQGIGPLNTPWARKRLICALKNLDVLSFRDYNSYGKALVEAEGLSGVPYKIVGDEAFSLPVASQDEIWMVLNAVGLSKGEQFVVVNFRNMDVTQDTTFLLDKIADLLDQIVTSTGKPIVFMPMSKGDEYGRDLQAGTSLKGMMKQSGKFFILEPMDSIELVKGIIGEAVYSLGLSYHLHVFSLSQGHPTIVLYSGDYYKIKSEGIVSYYGLPSRAVDFSDTSLEQALEYVLEVENRYDEACAHIRDVNKAMLEINDWTISMTKEALIEKGILAQSV